MRPTFMTEPPTFETLMDALAGAEKTINAVWMNDFDLFMAICGYICGYAGH